MTQNPLSRRQFLQIIAVGGVTGLTAKFSLDALSREHTIRETRLLMGTMVNFTVIHSEPTNARSAVLACIDKMENLEALLSRFQSESQVSQLNRLGKLSRPNQHLVALLRKSKQISEFSKGAFDITVKPVIDALQAGSVPTDEARGAVDYQKLGVDDNRVEFLNPGMGITLDGIAKGYIVDRGVEVLLEHGFENILVEAGGDLAAQGQRIDGEAWHIGVVKPRSENSADYLTIFSVMDQAVATSGDYIQYYQDDKSLHHIINPRTQTSPEELASVTVIAPTAMLADALSTTIMVLGLETGLQLVNQLPEVEMLVVRKNSDVRKSANFPGT